MPGGVCVPRLAGLFFLGRQIKIEQEAIMNLKRVKNGCHLHWPPTMAGAEKSYRGGPGTVVDLDAPLERDWIKGQEYKLEDAPKDAEPTELELPNAIGSRRKAEQEGKQKPAPTVAEKAKAAGIMDPVPPKQKPPVDFMEPSRK